MKSQKDSDESLAKYGRRVANERGIETDEIYSVKFHGRDNNASFNVKLNYFGRKTPSMMEYRVGTNVSSEIAEKGLDSFGDMSYVSIENNSTTGNLPNFDVTITTHALISQNYDRTDIPSLMSEEQADSLQEVLEVLDVSYDRDDEGINIHDGGLGFAPSGSKVADAYNMVREKGGTPRVFTSDFHFKQGYFEIDKSSHGIFNTGGKNIESWLENNVGLPQSWNVSVKKSPKARRSDPNRESKIR